MRFRWRDSKDHNQIKETSLDAAEFIRGFLLHLLPSGFVKIPGNGESLSRVVTPVDRFCRPRPTLCGGVPGLSGRTSSL